MPLKEIFYNNELFVRWIHCWKTRNFQKPNLFMGIELLFIDSKVWHRVFFQICSSDDLLGKSSGSRRLTWKSSGQRREVQTTSKKSRRLPGNSDNFVRRLLGSSDDFQTTLQEVQTTFRKSRRLPDDFQTTNKKIRHKNLPKRSEKSRRLPRSPDDILEVQTTSWKSRRLPGSPDDFVRRLPRSPDDFQTTTRRLTCKLSQKSSRSEKPAHQIQI
ncbi:hypothetical protein YC2023_045832 [Brassica napus]